MTSKRTIVQGGGNKKGGDGLKRRALRGSKKSGGTYLALDQIRGMVGYAGVGGSPRGGNSTRKVMGQPFVTYLLIEDGARLTPTNFTLGEEL